LVVRHTGFHTDRTLSEPRKLKRRRARRSLIGPKTGSAIAFLILKTLDLIAKGKPLHNITENHLLLLKQ
jgi:hypothetical protein